MKEGEHSTEPWPLRRDVRVGGYGRWVDPL